MYGFGNKRPLAKTKDMVTKDVNGMAEIISSMTYDQLRVLGTQIQLLVASDTTSMKHTKLVDMKSKDWVELLHAWANTDFGAEDESNNPMALEQDKTNGGVWAMPQK